VGTFNRYAFGTYTALLVPRVQKGFLKNQNSNTDADMTKLLKAARSGHFSRREASRRPSTRRHSLGTPASSNASYPQVPMRLSRTNVHFFQVRWPGLIVLCFSRPNTARHCHRSKPSGLRRRPQTRHEQARSQMINWHYFSRLRLPANALFRINFLYYM